MFSRIKKALWFWTSTVPAERSEKSDQISRPRLSISNGPETGPGPTTCWTPNVLDSSENVTDPTAAAPSSSTSSRMRSPKLKFSALSQRIRTKRGDVTESETYSAPHRPPALEKISSRKRDATSQSSKKSSKTPGSIRALFRRHKRAPKKTPHPAYATPPTPTTPHPEETIELDLQSINPLPTNELDSRQTIARGPTSIIPKPPKPPKPTKPTKKEAKEIETTAADHNHSIVWAGSVRKHSDESTQSQMVPEQDKDVTAVSKLTDDQLKELRERGELVSCTSWVRCERGHDCLVK